MGSASWSRADYTAKSSVYKTQSRSELFAKKTIREDFDPAKIVMRESVDSEINPESTPIIVGLDVTGSMGFIAEHIAKNSLGTLVEGILDTKPVSDPHVMMMAIGDIMCDSAPLQVTQFEADIRIAEQLTDLYLEGGGGGNSFESYDLPWLFASRKTKIDCFEKRGKKGYLFTMGDEFPPTVATNRQLNEHLAVGLQGDISINEVLSEAQVKYHVFHLIIEEGSFARRRLKEVTNRWSDLLGKRAICVNDHTKIAEIIQSVIQVSEGENVENVISQWEDVTTKNAVEYALYGGTGQ